MKPNNLCSQKLHVSEDGASGYTSGDIEQVILKRNKERFP
jgi:hypothetical protein